MARLIPAGIGLTRTAETVSRLRESREILSNCLRDSVASEIALSGEVQRLTALVQRLQVDRAVMLEALRSIHADAPAEEPEYDEWGDTEGAERWGLEEGAWTAGEIARTALEQVGADPGRRS